MNMLNNLSQSLMFNVLVRLEHKDSPWRDELEIFEALAFDAPTFDVFQHHLQAMTWLCFVDRDVIETAKGPLQKFRITTGGRFFLDAKRIQFEARRKLQARKPAIPQRVVPLETVDAVDCRQTVDVQAGVISCPTCDKRIAESAVVNGQPKQAGVRFTFFRPRWAFCDHCNRVFTWKQSCSSGGELYPTVLDKPRVITAPRHAEKFLARYPQAAGVQEA